MTQHSTKVFTIQVQTARLLQMTSEVYQLTVEIEHFHPAVCQDIENNTDTTFHIKT